MKPFEELFLYELNDVYEAEKRLARILGMLAKAAMHEGLRTALATCMIEAGRHVGVLDNVFQMFGGAPMAARCEGMSGLDREARDLLSGRSPDRLVDGGIPGLAQRGARIQIAAYEVLVEWARQLGRETEATMLGWVLQEERVAERRFRGMAGELAAMHTNVQARLFVSRQVPAAHPAHV